MAFQQLASILTTIGQLLTAFRRVGISYSYRLLIGIALDSIVEASLYLQSCTTTAETGIARGFARSSSRLPPLSRMLHHHAARICSCCFVASLMNELSGAAASFF